MGLSASQARFLQLTARRSNIEYEAQQISMQRLQIANKQSAAAEAYQDATSNRKLTFSFNTGSEVQKVDLSYQNYKNYMNQQLEGLTTSHEKFFLVSSSGNKVIVSSEDERGDMIQRNPELNADDFMIVEDLDDSAAFQKALQDGIYYFATLKENEETKQKEFQIQGLDTLGGTAISEEYDKSDDAEAEAEYNATKDKLQNIDKKLELRLNQLESERSAIQTEMESVQKVIDDNVEATFSTFS